MSSSPQSVPAMPSLWVPRAAAARSKLRRKMVSALSCGLLACGLVVGFFGGPGNEGGRFLPATALEPLPVPFVSPCPRRGSLLWRGFKEQPSAEVLRKISLSSLGRKLRSLTAAGRGSGIASRRVALAAASRSEDLVSPKRLTSMIRTAPTPNELLAVAELHAGDFDEIHCATFLYKVAKMHPKDVAFCTQSSIFQDLVTFTEYQVGNMEPYALSNLAWSIAKLHSRVALDFSRLLEAIVANSIQTIGQFEPQSLSNLAWSVAALRMKNEPLMDKIAAEAIRKMKQFEPQHLSNVAWSLAKLRIKKEPLMEEIAAEAIRKMKQLEPQALSNLAWSLATLRMKNEPLMEEIAAEAIRKIKQFDTQALSNLAWSMATLRMKNEPLMEVIAAEAIRKMKQFKPQHLSNLAWSMATLRMKNKPLMDQIAAEAIRKIKQFKPQELSNLAWSVAKLRILNGSLMAAIATESIRKIDGLTSQEIANLASAFTMLKIHNGPLMKELGAAMTRIRPRGDKGSADWACIVLACGKSGVHDQGVLMACAKEFLRKGALSRATSYSVSAALWAFKASGRLDEYGDVIDALQGECQRRGIDWADIDNELLEDPAQWVARFDRAGRSGRK